MAKVLMRRTEMWRCDTETEAQEVIKAATAEGGDLTKKTIEVKTKKAKGQIVDEMARTADVVMTIPDIHTLLLPILGVVPLQLFAYYVALMRGCDIDKPRNLAKSVTVE